MLAQESQMMRKANETITIMEMSPRDKWLYDSRMKYEHDRASCISEGYRQGIEVGILQGEIKGRQEGFSDGAYQTKLKTAKLMKQANCELGFIVQMTDLSKEEIEKL
ncbi:PD-(D/E)XK nuclease family transposase [Treponema denticola]